MAAPILVGAAEAVARAGRAIELRPALKARLSSRPAVEIAFLDFNGATAAWEHRVAGPRVGLLALAGSLYVLPARRPARAPCLNCLLISLERNNSLPKGLAGKAGRADVKPCVAFRGLAPSALPLGLEIAADALDRMAGAHGDSSWLWRIGERGVSVRREWLHAAEVCPCRGPPRSAAPRAEELRARPRRAGSPLRERTTDELAPIMLDRCVGRHAGLVQEYKFDLQMPFAACAAWSGVAPDRREPTLGRGSRFTRARTVALVEALERRAGLFGGVRRIIREAAFDELGTRAVDPRSIGLHPDSLYDRPGFPFRRFDPRVAIPWVEALDLTNQREVLLPYCFAFYGRNSGAPALAFETSNGCASGSSLAEAALHGLLELVERDAFLDHWYRRRPCARLDEEHPDLAGLKPLLDRIYLFTGARTRLFSTTQPHGIPSVMAIGTRDHGDGPVTAAAAGAGLTFFDAARASLFELGGHFLRLISSFRDEQLRSRLLVMLEDHDEVRTMEDHGLVNALPEARDRFSAICSEASVDGFINAPLGDPGPAPADVLRMLVDRLREVGCRVIVVDQTIDALAAHGLRAAKVVVPGWLPMTFGHGYRRTDLPRLAGTDASLLPHPFP